ATVGVGIDLGTSTSSVAIYKDKKPTIIQFKDLLSTPSCVAFTDNEVLFGSDAKEQLPNNPRNTIYGVKRLIGRKFEDIEPEMSHWPFEITKGEGGNIMLTITYKGQTEKLTPEQIVAMQLAELKNAADCAAGTITKHVVISVPADYNNAQRQATLDAAAIAGFQASLISEPAATILHYDFDNEGDLQANMNVLVFDLGGGTIDVSIVTRNQKTNSFEVKATSGSTRMGGIDFTNRLVKHFTEEFEKKNKKDFTSDPKALCRLREACEKAKIQLSSSHQTDIKVEGIDFTINVSREEFERICTALFNQAMAHVSTCLHDPEMDNSSIQRVLLVGYSTLIPKIRKLLTDLFPKIKQIERLKHAVAYGAVMAAASRAGYSRFASVIDVYPRPFVVKYRNEEERKFAKNFKIPGFTGDKTSRTTRQKEVRVDKKFRSGLCIEKEFWTRADRVDALMLCLSHIEQKVSLQIMEAETAAGNKRELEEYKQMIRMLKSDPTASDEIVDNQLKEVEKTAANLCNTRPDYSFSPSLISILYHNARSVVNKLGDLDNLLGSVHLDILCITESWCKECHTSNLKEMAEQKGFTMFKCDKKVEGDNVNESGNELDNDDDDEIVRCMWKKGGGILLFIRKKYHCVIVPNIFNNCECLAIDIKVSDSTAKFPKWIRLCVVYRAFDYEDDHYQSQADCLSYIVKSSKHPVVFVGDFNSKHLSKHKRKTVDRIMDKFVADNCLTHLINCPTRFHRGIDWLLTNYPYCIRDPTIIEPMTIHSSNITFLKSDHSGIAFDIDPAALPSPR
ncbi:hypothetical protein PFISCL1PPCAC_9270, partial [Pristionchus fissidentatus]